MRSVATKSADFAPDQRARRMYGAVGTSIKPAHASDLHDGRWMQALTWFSVWYLPSWRYSTPATTPHVCKRTDLLLAWPSWQLTAARWVCGRDPVKVCGTCSVFSAWLETMPGFGH